MSSPPHQIAPRSFIRELRTNSRSTELSSNDSLTTRGAAMALIGLAVALLLAHGPSLVLHIADLWSRPHYRFVPFLIPGVFILAQQRLRDLQQLRPGGLFSVLLFAFAWLQLATAIVFDSPWLGMVSFLVSIAALIWTAGGIDLFRRLLPAWALLWLAVPLPLDYDDSLISALQTYTANTSSAMLDQIGILHVLIGNTLEVDGRRLLVEEECAGAHSFFALVPMTIFFVMWRKRRAVVGLLLVLAAAIWVLIANVSRVVLITILSSRIGIDVTQGWRHDALGILVYAAAVALVLSTDRLLLFGASFRFRQRSKYNMRRSRSTVTTSGASEPVRFGTRKVVLCGVTMFAFSILSLGHATLLWGSLQKDRHALASELQFDTLQANSLPQNAPGWTLIDYSTEHRSRTSESGEFSQVWRYRFRGRPAQISLDYPFTGWHELPHCYRTQGWTIESRDQYSDSSEDPNDSAVVHAKLTRPFGPNGYLLFAVFDGSGHPLTPKTSFTPRHHFLDRFWSRLETTQERLTLSRKESLEDHLPTYQVQLFIASDVPLKPAEEQEASRFLRQVADHISAVRSAPASQPR